MTSDGAPGRNLSFRYRLQFADGRTEEISVELDYRTLSLVAEQAADPPPWTRLGFHQCPGCPLEEATHPHCPIARNLVPVVDLLKDRVSHERVDVEVETAGRRYAKSVSLQEAAGALIGIFNVTSGCPVFDKLRPMVATHLPFMTADEATYRMISTYLMSQYFLHRRGHPADLALAGFLDFLNEARETNTAFCDRLHAIGVKDASLNALSNLNAMGEIVSLSIQDEELARWEALFVSAWAEAGGSG